MNITLIWIAGVTVVVAISFACICGWFIKQFEKKLKISQKRLIHTLREYKLLLTIYRDVLKKLKGIK
jgi:hypothetical protein